MSEENARGGHELKPIALLGGTVANLIAAAVASALIALFGFVWAAIKEANPWVLASLIGWFLSALIAAFALNRMKRQFTANLRALSESHEAEVQRLKEEFRVQISNVTQVQHGDFEKRTEAHHDFVHAARDAFVRCYPHSLVKGPRSISIFDALNKKSPTEVQVMLEAMVRTFRPLVPPDIKLYAAIRERTGLHQYVTKIRVGNCDHVKREAGTQPLQGKDRFLIDLETSFWRNQCVIITGSEEPNWQPQHNDWLKEDLAVLMGAVFSKQLLPRRQKKDGVEWQPMNLEWIVCLCADKKGVFNRTHLPLMKCFNDIFALLLNTIIRFPVPQGKGSQPLSNS